MQGESFDRICRMTTLFEGSIIRCFRRLSELLLQLASASHKVAAPLLPPALPPHLPASRGRLLSLSRQAGLQVRKHGSERQGWRDLERWEILAELVHALPHTPHLFSVN